MAKKNYYLEVFHDTQANFAENNWLVSYYQDLIRRFCILKSFSRKLLRALLVALEFCQIDNARKWIKQWFRWFWGKSLEIGFITFLVKFLKNLQKLTLKHCSWPKYADARRQSCSVFRALIVQHLPIYFDHKAFDQKNSYG